MYYLSIKFRKPLKSAEFNSDVVENLEYPDGPFWTAWAEWYGCAETTQFGEVIRPDIATKKGTA